MIKRTLYFGNAVHLSTTKEQLVVQYPDGGAKKTVPLEDIGTVVIDHYQITLSSTLLCKMLSHHTALITCDQQHMPQGMMLNLAAKHKQQAHFVTQISATDDLKNGCGSKRFDKKF